MRLIAANCYMALNTSAQAAILPFIWREEVEGKTTEF
jgi:hypothetical protein